MSDITISSSGSTGLSESSSEYDPDEREAMAARLQAVRSRMAAACARAGRSPEDVVLLPVSKTFGPETVRAAMSLGLTRFGENKTQEIAKKVNAVDDADWVMIGHLQTNKAKEAARLASEVQSLDRLALAEALERRLQHEGRAIDVLIQVKTSPEPSKFGLDPDGLPQFVARLSQFDTLRVCGLMTMAVNSPDESAVRRCFNMLRVWRERLQADGAGTITRLSMGMSGDFELAIEEGATEVRVGSAIFGKRDYGAHA